MKILFFAILAITAQANWDKCLNKQIRIVKELNLSKLKSLTIESSELVKSHVRERVPQVYLSQDDIIISPYYEPIQETCLVASKKYIEAKIKIIL